MPGALGLLALLLAWELAGRTVFATSGVVPPPTAISAQLFNDGLDFYWPNIVTTLREAGAGWLYGNLIAVALAVTFVQIPLVERALLQLALASYCLPVIAIGPVLAVLFSDDTPKVILAALSVIFTTLVGTLVGLRSADRTSLDLVRAYGGGSWTQLWRVRLRACLPGLFAGLRIAAPAAMLGAIIGEYLGAESGLGVAMINSQQSLAVERTWGIALVATALSGAAYGLTALAGTLLTPWAPRVKR
ncbi:ABC transporter permease [Dactylosporangium siamense]|uniref:ABC transporter permease n=1 Tax=Dactylosporangium siamense TaxID=685454 RepID=A0A919PFB9_9ACTN|nr:ABC transporter permease [Dactylosporangium siamense]